MSLQELGLKHNTDKAHTHFYMDNYEKHLEPLRDKEITLLEIGIAGGCSLNLWNEYFKNANVYGIDNNPECAKIRDSFIGNQTDKEFLDMVLAEIGEIDIVIDDGSHIGQDMIDTFKYLFPRMKNTGLFVLEDFHCAYSKTYSGDFQSNGRTVAYNFFTDLAYHVDVAGRAMTGNAQYAIESGIIDPPVPEYSRILKAIHIYPSLRIFERK